MDTRINQMKINEFLSKCNPSHVRCEATTNREWGRGKESAMISHIVSLASDPSKRLRFEYLESYVTQRTFAVYVWVFEKRREREFHCFRFD